MRIKTLTLLVILSVGFFSTTAWAQDGDQREKSKKELEELAKDRQSLVDEDIDSLSGQQQLNRGKRKISDMKKALGQTNALLDEARKKERDILKINCINDKLAAIKGFLKVAEQSYVKLKDADSQADSEELNHHYTLISISDQKIDKLHEEARLCAGEVERYAKGTKVDVEVDDDIASTRDYIPSQPSSLMVLPELTPFH